jgi:hypothetical protein
MAALIKKSKPNFTYKERTSEDMESRQKSFSGRDSYFSNNMKFFTTKSGNNKIRIMPPTWEDAKHYGFDIYVHYGIGPDNVGYLCLDRMSAEKCPLCEARAEADRDGDEDLAKALRATRRVAVYVIDRGAEGEGPKVWAMPQTVDKEICAQAWDKETGEVYALDHPDEGYDVSFDVEGQGQTKKYVGVRLARRASPLSDDDKQAAAWLQHIVDYQIPEELVLHTYEEMKQAFEGKPKKGEDEDTDKPSIKGKSKTAEGEDEGEDKGGSKTRPRIGGKKPEVKKKEKEKPTWEEVHEMDEDALGVLAEEQGVDFGDTEFTSLSKCQDFVCEQLEIEETPDPEETDKPKGNTKLADRLRNMGKKKK